MWNKIVIGEGTPVRYYLGAFKMYSQFSGRASRKEFWVFMLLHFTMMFILGIVDIFAGLYNDTLSIGFLGGVYLLASFIPYLAIMCRRLHDVGKDGFNIFLGMVPIAGFYLVYLLAKAGMVEDNEYGQNPLKTSAIIQSDKHVESCESTTDSTISVECKPEVVAIKPHILFCRICGEKLPSENSLYCNKCGTKVMHR